MTIKIKPFILEESLLDSLKNNWDKIALGGLGVAAANAGAFGEDMQSLTQSGLKGASDMVGKTADYYKNPNTNQHPGDTDGDGNPDKFTGDPIQDHKLSKDRLETAAENAKIQVQDAKDNERELRDYNADNSGLFSSALNNTSNFVSDNGAAIGGLAATGALGAAAVGGSKYKSNNPSNPSNPSNKTNQPNKSNNPSNQPNKKPV